MDEVEREGYEEGQSAIWREMDRYCPDCRNELEWMECDQCEDGEVDGYEDDPLWYSPGEMEVCSACCGAGGSWYCPCCARG